MDTEAQLIEIRAQMEQMKAQMAETAAAMGAIGEMPLLEEKACYGLESLNVGDGCFIVRWCKGEEEKGVGQWEILLPPGCCAVGGSCEAMNRPASNTEKHGNEENWYKLYLNEDEGSWLTDAEGIEYKKWDIIVHAKTSAGRCDKDNINTSHRYVYVSAVPHVENEDEDSEARTRERYNSLGDEFSRVVAVAYVKVIDGESVRTVEQVTSNAINVAANIASDFRLVWWFDLNPENQTVDRLYVKKVYCVANSMSAAGMVLKGDDMVDVSEFANIETLDDEEKHRIYARIRTNENLRDENIVEVILDPDNTNSDDFAVWLELYKIDKYGKVVDSRAAALTNVQIYR